MSIQQSGHHKGIKDLVGEYVWNGFELGNGRDVEGQDVVTNDLVGFDQQFDGLVVTDDLDRTIVHRQGNALDFLEVRQFQPVGDVVGFDIEKDSHGFSF